MNTLQVLKVKIDNEMLARAKNRSKKFGAFSIEELRIHKRLFH